MIHEEICTYEVCKLAKEKGFPQDVFGTCEMKSACYLGDGRFYKDGCIYPIENAYTAPTQSLLQRWLREEKKIYVCPCIISDYEDDYTPHIVYWSFIIVNTESGDSIYREYERVDEKRFDTYELALEDALKYALEKLV